MSKKNHNIFVELFLIEINNLKFAQIQARLSKITSKNCFLIVIFTSHTNKQRSNGLN